MKKLLIRFAPFVWPLNAVLVLGMAWYWFFGPVYSCGGCSNFSKDMAYSFRQEPSRWHLEPVFHVVRDDGTDFWIGNGASYFSPWCCLPSVPLQWEGGSGFASREQRYVYTAYNAWRRNYEREFAQNF